MDNDCKEPSICLQESSVFSESDSGAASERRIMTAREAEKAFEEMAAIYDEKYKDFRRYQGSNITAEPIHEFSDFKGTCL